MKNIFRTISLCLLMMTIPVVKSHAIVGVATGNAPLALAGLAAPGVGYVGVFIGDEIGLCHEFACLNIFAIGILAGIVMLDSETSTVTFSELAPDQAVELGVSNHDLNIYNSEVTEVNALFEEVTHELNANSTIEEARAIWDEYSEYLSPSTYKVIKSFK